MTSRAATCAAGSAGVLAAIPATYLAALSTAALVSAPRPVAPWTGVAPRVAVLVPAHNESLLIGRCLASLRDQAHPDQAYDVIVIADNCDDDTADISRAAGARVLERHDPSAPGKGPALRWAIGRLLADEPEIEAFIVVDADSVTDPGMLSALVGAYARGAEVVQADYAALVDGDDSRSQLRAAAFLLFHRVRFTGKARLGLSCSLVGNGMLFSRRVCRDVPWSAFSEVEDLEHSLTLRLAGEEITFAPDAHLVAPVASGGRAAQVQRTRWEGGRARIARRYLPELVRAVGTGRRDLWDAAVDLAVPPLGVLAAGIVAGGAATSAMALTGTVQARAVAPWVLAGAALSAHVLVGMRAGDAPPQMRRALTDAPGLVLSELGTRLRAAAAGRTAAWERTPRGD